MCNNIIIIFYFTFILLYYFYVLTLFYFIFTLAPVYGMCTSNTDIYFPIIGEDRIIVQLLLFKNKYF